MNMRDHMGGNGMRVLALPPACSKIAARPPNAQIAAVNRPNAAETRIKGNIIIIIK